MPSKVDGTNAFLRRGFQSLRPTFPKDCILIVIEEPEKVDLNLLCYSQDISEVEYCVTVEVRQR